MNILIDTHILLWMVRNDPKLSESVRSIIAAHNNRIFISLASVWELAIKSSLGKLELKRSIEDFVKTCIVENNLQILDIKLRHLYGVANLPFHHGDPFDRLIISQAQIENLPIISADKKFDNYSVERIW